MIKAGTASIDITPRVGTALGGNCTTDNRSRGIHDHLMANILVLQEVQQTDSQQINELKANEHQPLILIGMDLLGILREDADRIKRIIKNNYNISESNIMVFVTHTHSGPNVIKIFEPNYTSEQLQEIDNYLLALPERVLEGVDKAMSQLFDCQISFASEDVSGFSFNRRAILRDGSLKMVFEDFDRTQIASIDGPVEYPKMSVLKITDLSGKTKCILVNYTSHPAIACGTDWLFSRDYVHALTTGLQETYGNDLVVLYANGSQGNIVPSDPRNPFITGFEEADRIGRALSEAATGILRSAEIQKNISLRILTETILLPVRQISENEIADARKVLSKQDSSKLQFHGIDPRIEALGILKLADYPGKYIETILQILCIGNICIVTLPGEVFVQYGLQIIAESPFEHTMIFGLANDYIGYVPVPDAFKLGGYEIKSSFRSSMLDKPAGEIIVSKVGDILKRISTLGMNMYYPT